MENKLKRSFLFSSYGLLKNFVQVLFYCTVPVKINWRKITPERFETRFKTILTSLTKSKLKIRSLTQKSLVINNYNKLSDQQTNQFIKN